MPRPSAVAGSFELEVVPDRDLVRLVVTGELDLAAVPTIDRHLSELREVGWSRVEVDLSGVDLIDTQAAHALGDWRCRAASEGFELRVRPPVERGPARVLALLEAVVA
jgi:anti-anti-sigma regulatory factor